MCMCGNPKQKTHYFYLHNPVFQLNDIFRAERFLII